MEDHIKKWEAMLAEYDAKADKMDAETRLKYNDWRENMQAELEASGDWTEATWDEFVAKAKKQWHELAIKVGD